MASPLLSVIWRMLQLICRQNGKRPLRLFQKTASEQACPFYHQYCVKLSLFPVRQHLVQTGPSQVASGISRIFIISGRFQPMLPCKGLQLTALRRPAGMSHNLHRHLPGSKVPHGCFPSESLLSVPLFHIGEEVFAEKITAFRSAHPGTVRNPATVEYSVHNPAALRPAAQR